MKGGRGMGSSQEIHQLGAQVGDGRKRCGYAELGRHGRAPSQEMHQLGVPVGDGQRGLERAEKGDVV